MPENRGTVNATTQATWLHGILKKFGIHTYSWVYIYCDNHSAIKISNDQVQKQQTKHIEVHMHYIHELVHNKAIILHYCPIEEHIADIFTKSFTKNIFFYLISLLGVKVWFNYCSWFCYSFWRAGGSSMRFSPFPQFIEQLIFALDCMGDLWS